jgi:hypothetical protein
MYGWIKSGRDKISARGPQIGPYVHHPDKQIELDSTKREKQTNKRIKDSQ